MHSFGRADRLDRAALERLVASIRRILEGEVAALSTAEVGSAGRIAVEAGFGLGIVHVTQALWARLGIGEAVRGRSTNGGCRRHMPTALLTMVAERLDRPGSKLACHERWLDRVWLPEARGLGLHQLYRALDVLAEHGAAIQQALFSHEADLFKLDVDLVFHDADHRLVRDQTRRTWPPTVARWPALEPLRRRGRSTEEQSNDPQVVIALAVTREGVPVRSWVFPGATPDVATVRTIKADLREMRLGRVLLIRAMPGSIREPISMRSPRGPGATSWPRSRSGACERSGTRSSRIPAATPVDPSCAPRRWCSARASAAGATSCA